MTAQPASRPEPLTSLTALAERFRLEVTRELEGLEPAVRASLRGDYLFHIDGEPRFVVAIESAGATSGLFLPMEDGDPVAILTGPAMLPGATTHGALRVSEVEHHARATVRTDATTLARLLSGTMKAKAAFLAGKVSIDGDLPCFLRLIGLLKARGVKPPSR